MVKAIIFDCFGVLATDGWLPFREKYFGGKPELYNEVDRLNKEMNSGLISYPEFVGQVSKLAGITDTELDHYIDSNVPNAQLLDYIKSDLKRKYKIGVLSNAGTNWLDIIFSKEQLKVFDGTAMSFEIGSIKPDRGSYEYIAKKLGVKPENCVFVDDQHKHCVGAEQAGMKAIQYKDFDQMKRDLTKLLK